MSSQNTTLSWDQLLELAQITLLLDECRPGQLPSTAPIPSSLHKLPPETHLFCSYRDANSWCPFERVWFFRRKETVCNRVY